MSGKGSNSLKELRSLREAVLSEEKAKAKAIIENLPPNQTAPKRKPPPSDPPPAPPVQPEADPVPPVETTQGPEPEVPDGILEKAFTSEPGETEPESFAAIEPAPVEPAPADPDDDPLAPIPPPATEPELIAPAPVPFPMPQPQAPAPPAPQVHSPPPQTARPKSENVLLVPLTPKMQDRLVKHVDQSRWSPADVVIELIRSQLHRGYPAIVYGDQVLARGGTYRTIERNPFESVLTIVSGQGVFHIGVKPDSREYKRWLGHFQSHQSSSPEEAAIRVCLFELQKYLEDIEDFSLEDWTKRIALGTYSLEKLV